jgi:hypothetical protein
MVTTGVSTSVSELPVSLDFIFFLARSSMFEPETSIRLARGRGLPEAWQRPILSKGEFGILELNEDADPEKERTYY